MTGLIFRTAVLMATCVTVALGQSPHFVVASIHPTQPAEAEQGQAPEVVGGPGTSDPGRIAYSRIPLLSLISIAFETTGDRIIGSQTGLSTRYNVTATIAPGSRKQDVPAMLKTLLQERFEVKTHLEQKTKNLYRLLVAKGGIKFGESHPEPSDTPPSGVGAPDKNGFPILPPSYTGIVARASNGRMLIRGQNATIGELIKWLEPALGRGTLDGTGLGGKYDFKLAFRSTSYSGNPTPNSQNDNDPGDTVFDALSLLGLRAESFSDAVDFVVIDHVLKEPLPN